MIPLFAVHMPPDVDKPLLEVIHSGYVGQGKKVDEFEAALRPILGSRNVVTVNSGTMALEMALRLAGVGPGTEVITTSQTCTATNMPILARGGKPVWADIDPYNGNIDPLDVERKITRRTKAIMCVHWGGNPCDMAELRRIADKYEVKLIEDCAHSWGMDYPVPERGDYRCYSLQAIKHINTFDGGVLVTGDGDDYRKAKLMRWYGLDRETDKQDMRCEIPAFDWGYKGHMNDVCATVGLVQLGFLKQIVAAHRAHATTYMKNLPVGFEAVGMRTFSSYWLFTLLLPDRHRRLRFMSWMQRAGIMVSQVHSPNHLHPCFAESNVSPLPGTDEFAARQVAIPVHWNLTPEEVDKIVGALYSFEAQGQMTALAV